MTIPDIAKFIDITDEDVAEASKASIKIIVDVFSQFIKTVKAKLVYPVSSKLPQQFRENLFASLTGLLERYEELSFKVEADSISYRGTDVYKSSVKTDNFAHSFFRDGIVGFKFKSGLTLEELEKFVDIASQMTRSVFAEDDAATLLWEAGFEHICYELMDDFIDIETFEYGTDSLKRGVSASADDLKNMFENAVELDLSEEDFDLNSEKNRSRNVPSAYRNIEDKVANFISDIANYSDSEKAAMANMLEADYRFNHIGYAADILFEILGLEVDSAGYNDTLDLLAKVSTDFIKSGDFKSAILLMERAAELGRVLKNREDSRYEKLFDFVDKFAASEKIRIIVDYLNKSKDIDYMDVTNYLKLLSWKAIDPLVWALGELEHFSARRAVCQALEVLAGDHPDLLGKGIENPRWYVIRNIVSILGKIGDPRAFNYFRRSIQHPDIRVRRETITSAAKIVTNEAADFLVAALNDPDEKIQMLALREIVGKKMIIAFSQVEAIIADKGFKNRSAEQIREFLAGFAILGEADAFETLRRIIQDWSLIPSEKNERLRIHAVRALGFVKTQEASMLLEKIANSRNKKLSDISRRTLNKIKRGEELV